jgi:AraC-like DNA-binding protein
MLLLDTDDVPAAQRADAFRDAVGQTGTVLTVLAPPGAFRARVHVWQYGQTTLLATESSGHRLERGSPHLPAAGAAFVSVSTATRGQARFSQFGRDSVVTRRTLVLADPTEPYWASAEAGGRTWSFRMPTDRLALPPDVLRAAAGRLPASPLHGLVLGQLHQLADRAEEIAADPGATAFGTATTDLVRALLTSATAPDQLPEAEAPVTRVRSYVGAHLTEPDLAAGRIARAQNMSVRQLYKICAAAGLSLEQSIIDQRLEWARSALASPVGRRRSIQATALASGFTDASHFSRRFRDAFGMTPRDWQHAARGT